MQRVILHIDFDSFFASVEQQCNPLLRGKPVGVTASNGRTCIIAASREAKKFGIGTASSTYDGFRRCPDLQLVKADFEKYFSVSKKFIRICKDFSPYIEVFSIDELFMDITLTAKLFGGVESLLIRLKERIKQDIGECITVSIGVSSNKLLAKLGSGWNKPCGVTYITEENVEEFYAKAKLTDICGIGSRIEKRLQGMGIYSLLQLRKTPLRSLVAEFGHVEGNFLYHVGQGTDADPVKSFSRAPDAKSVSRQYCLARNEYDERVILQNIAELCEELAIKLRRLEKKSRHVGVYLRGNIDLGGHLLLSDFTYSGKTIFDTCRKILYRQVTLYDNAQKGLFETSFGTDTELHIPGYVRRMSVWVGDFADEKNIPLSLFQEYNKRQELDDVVDKLNDKFGVYTVRNGFLLHAKKLKTVPNGFLGDRYERILLAKDKSLTE